MARWSCTWRASSSRTSSWSLRDEHGFNMCIDVTAVDYLGYEAPRRLPAEIDPERFEIVVNLLRMRDRTRVRVRVQVPERRPVGAVAVRRASRHRGDGTGGVRHVRHHLRRPSGPVPHPDAGGLDRPSAAQGLRRSARSPCSSRESRTPDDARRRDVRGRAGAAAPQGDEGRGAAARDRFGAADVGGGGRRSRARENRRRTRR